MYLVSVMLCVTVSPTSCLRVVSGRGLRYWRQICRSHPPIPSSRPWLQMFSSAGRLSLSPSTCSNPRIAFFPCHCPTPTSSLSTPRAFVAIPLSSIPVETVWLSLHSTPSVVRAKASYPPALTFDIICYFEG